MYCQNSVTAPPFKSEDLSIVKATSLRANDFTPTLLGGMPPGLLSKRSICCPNLVTKIRLEVNYVMMDFFECLKFILW